MAEKTCRIYIGEIPLVLNLAAQRDPKAILQLNCTDQSEYSALKKRHTEVTKNRKPFLFLPQ